MRARITVIVKVTDKRRKLGDGRFDAYCVESTEEVEKLYKKISKYPKEKLIYLYTDLEGYEKPVYCLYDALDVLNKCALFIAHVSAINECCEKYNGLEDDIEELLIEDEPFENIDNHLREILDDSLYNYMAPKYVPKRTYIGLVLQDCLNECRSIVIKDLHENKIIYCKNFFIKNISYLEEYKEKLKVIMNNSLDVFLMTQELIVEEKNKHCRQQVYFF